MPRFRSTASTASALTMPWNTFPGSSRWPATRPGGRLGGAMKSESKPPKAVTFFPLFATLRARRVCRRTTGA